MPPSEYIKNKKVLIMGLGLLGGGIATTKWLVKHGAKVTVTDLKSRADLAGSIKALGPAIKKVKLVLGKHNESDFKNNQIIVVNPAVPKESPFLKIAREAGVTLENEATLFFNLCSSPIIAVTGTRGKTTTVNWILHFLNQKYPNSVLTGNSSDSPMLGVLDGLDGQSPVVVELSSWHLELLPVSKKSPHISVITNIYPDHLNRYKNLTAYAQAKANIFKHQTKNDFLILNKKNPWTKFFLKQSASWRTKSKIIYSSIVKPPGFNKSFVQHLVLNMGEHNLQNLVIAALAANLAGVDWNLIKKAVKTLPQIKFRQEIIYQKDGLTIVNDTTATSPDATIAALNRFAYRGSTSIVLITGGTSKNLEFNPPVGGWARAVKKHIKPANLFLLDGSATKKMLDSLGEKYFKKSRPQLYLDFNILLTSALKHAKLIKGKKVLLFSPSAASFEKFKNEFDRGERFNQFFKERS
ncbi:MAG: UDP-N-acetylmuramoyl-L-alanine--D-glutamate ligase [bacterium]|nr:UDP-N-acetylmuramoyl-L-alanine--D-glutamate ligase [bacterium]